MSSEKLTPFDFLKSINETKKDLITTSDDPEHTAKEYTPFIVNKGLSFFVDTVLHANEMNMYHCLPGDAQYRYYLNIIRSKKRYSKWHKPEEDAKLDLIQEYFQVNRNVAKQYMKVLTDEQITIIKQRMHQGGIVNGKGNK